MSQYVRTCLASSCARLQSLAQMHCVEKQPNEENECHNQWKKVDEHWTINTNKFDVQIRMDWQRATSQLIVHSLSILLNCLCFCVGFSSSSFPIIYLDCIAARMHMTTDPPAHNKCRRMENIVIVQQIQNFTTNITNQQQEKCVLDVHLKRLSLLSIWHCIQYTLIQLRQVDSTTENEKTQEKERKRKKKKP